jgi:branched-subunit amino acid ABC-type transport system permease component
MIALAAIGLVLWLVLERTRLGAMIRATVDDAEMARGIGIDTARVSMLVFVLGRRTTTRCVAARRGRVWWRSRRSVDPRQLKSRKSGPH